MDRVCVQVDSGSSTEDFYSLLKCDESSSAEQISTEFKLLAKKHHPDKVADPGEKEAAEKHFLQLKKARDVLLDKETRQRYDQWRASFRKWISFEDWLKMQSRIHTSIHWATNRQKMARLEQHGETSGGDGGSCSSCSDEGGGRGSRCESDMVRDEAREKGGSSRGSEDVGRGGREVSTALHQFRRSGSGGTRGSKFRNYQI